MDDSTKKFPVSRRGARVTAQFRVMGHGADYFFSDFARDVSIHGMCVNSIRPLAIDQQVRLRFHLREEEVEESPISVTCRVRWVGLEPKIRGASHRHGVEFVDLSEDARLRLESYISGTRQPGLSN